MMYDTQIPHQNYIKALNTAQSVIITLLKISSNQNII